MITKDKYHLLIETEIRSFLLLWVPGFRSDWKCTCTHHLSSHLEAMAKTVLWMTFPTKNRLIRGPPTFQGLFHHE